MDRRNSWSRKKRFKMKFQEDMEKLEMEKKILRKKYENLQRLMECQQNAIHLAAAVLIQMEANDEKITNVKECNGCDRCGGNDGCYIVEVQK